jgi:prepilin-type N-terminal cleavage/methylation domain-containing protein
MMAPRAQSGFSLVELSIVLVILGLLTGGILAGQSLIRAAELRSVSTEAQRYLAAVNSFRDKYFALPGDMASATKFWTAEPAANCPGDQTTPSTTPATCNGNGDGMIAWHNTAGLGGESHRFWQHLANAGLVEGTYSGTHSGGTCNGNGSCNVTIGINAPRSKLSSAGWTIHYLGTQTTVGSTYYFAGSYGNAFAFGSNAGGQWTYDAVLKPEEAWNIDTKTDDGRPATGSVTPWEPTNFPDCTNADNAAAVYRLDRNFDACQLVLKTGF